MPAAGKISSIRLLMEQRGVDVYLIPDTDTHLGEYVPDHWRIIRWLTGFTGSSATLIITSDFAGLWTDSRYLIQAEKQLRGSGFELMEPGSSEKTGYLSWLSTVPDHHSMIGLDGRLISISRFRKINNDTAEKKFTLDPECDLITPLWTDRPPLPSEKAFEHTIEFAGKERELKLQEVRGKMKTCNVDYHLLTSPDDIMWLLNMRGRDVDFSPLLMAFAIVTTDQVLLFTDEDKIPYKLAKEFDRIGIIILPYEETAGMLSTLRPASGILMNPSLTSVALYSSIPGRLEIMEDVTIPARMKAVKNSIELSNLGNAMIRDGVALTRFFYQVEHDSGIVPMSELSLTKKLDKLRTGLDNFVCPSFPTIVAYNSHGALPHYTASSETDSLIVTGGLLLVDSGGHYHDGTTDITRTVSLGNPGEAQRKDFTLVLRGMINLATATFPAETAGYQLDILARQFLWENGINYGHGTGHGVGYCLNVHEGPQRISPSALNAATFIEPGMIISDEPAVYREGEYGIRTENLLLCYEDEETEFGKFFRFSTLTLCYIDKSLIEISLLEKKEIEWLNNYHAEVYDKLSPHLSQAEREWLGLKTSPLSPVP